MEKKSNKGLIIVIVILSLLLVGVSGYLVYDKVFTKDDVKENNQAEEKDSLESNDKEQENNDKKDDTVEEKGEPVSEKEKAKILNVINDINNYNLGKYDNLNPSEISNQEKLAFVSWIVWKKQLNGENGSIAGLKGSKVIDVYKKYFGSNDSIINEDIYADKVNCYGYDKNKDIYVEKHNFPFMAVPGERTESYSFILDATKKEDVYTVKVHSVYETICPDVCADMLLAGSYEEASNLLFFTGMIHVMQDQKGNVNLVDSNYELMSQESINEIHKGYNDRLPVYTYTFVLENGNYVLKNKTIEKKWVMAK